MAVDMKQVYEAMNKQRGAVSPMDLMNALRPLVERIEKLEKELAKNTSKKAKSE